MRLILLCLLSLPAFASRSGDALKSEFVNGEFRATLKEGYHFNSKAPNRVNIDDAVMKPAKLEAREMSFVGFPEKFSKARAALYVCDDAVTFCETQFVELKGEGGTQNARADKPKHRGRVNKFGFIEDDFQKALADAKKKKQPVVVDFGARWCPSCVRQEKETFGTSEFKKMTKNFVKLKVDVDRFENVVLAEKYGVKGIPTMVVVNSEGAEIDRIVDYQPLSILEPFFSAIEADPTSLAEQKAKADTPEKKLQLGLRLFNAGRPDEAVPYLEAADSNPPELIEARILDLKRRYANEPNLKKQLAGLLTGAIAAEPSSYRALVWRAMLAPLVEKDKEKAKIRTEGVTSADAMLRDSAILKEALKNVRVGEFTGYESLMVAMSRAELVEAAGGSDAEVEQANKRAADVGLSLDIKTSNVGVNMRLLTVLLKARRFEDADRLTASLLKREPKNTELQRRRMRVLVELRKYNEAIVMGRQVVKNSYGRNEFWAAELLARAYIQGGRQREARVLIEDYLARNEMDWPNMASSRKMFEELKSKLPAETN